MSADNFNPNGGSREYDFSAIANAAVSALRSDGGDSSSPQNTDDLYENLDVPSADRAVRAPVRRPRSLDGIDNPVTRSDISGEPSARRSASGFNRRSGDSEQRDTRRPFAGDKPKASPRRPFMNFARRSDGAGDGDNPVGMPAAHEQNSAESSPRRPSMNFTRRSKGAGDGDNPVGMPAAHEQNSAEGSPRRPFMNFTRKSEGSSAAENPVGMPAAREQDSAESSPRRPFRNFARKPEGAGDGEFFPDTHSGNGAETASAPRKSPVGFPGSPRTADQSPSPRSSAEREDPAAAQQRRDALNSLFDESHSGSSAQSPAQRSSPDAGQQPSRRVFNAAVQPNYGYMSDSSERSSSPEPTAGVFSSLMASVSGIFNKNDPSVEYYTPPAGSTASAARRHQKLRNRRPWPQWAKATVFSLCLAAVFTLILFVSFYTIVTSRINYVADINRPNAIRTSPSEKVNLAADKTSVEENATEFTAPLSVAPQSDKVKVILVVSSDSQIGDNDDRTARTDAVMLVALDTENRRIRIASIMTDTYVRIRNYKTNKLSKAYYYDTANGDFSLSCLRQAIEDNFGIVPDNYVVVDFDAFQILINRLGGVDIEVSADEAYYMSSHERYGDFPRFNSAGRYTMSGAEALNYARMRAVGNDDYDRVARQRKVFAQVMNELRDMSLFELSQLAYAMLPELPTDMSAGDFFGYLVHASDIASYEITEVTFPITNSWRYGTASVRDQEGSGFQVVTDGSNINNSNTDDGGENAGSTVPAVDPAGTEFTVIVTNFQFNASALQSYLYDNDESYLNGTAAYGISIPELVAPLKVDSPAAGLDPGSYS